METVRQVDGVEVGFDPGFEDRWWAAMKSIWGIMTLLVCVGLTGLLGRGPLNMARSQSGNLEARYERMLRFKSPSQIELEVASDRKGALDLRFEGSCFRDGGVRSVVPQPLASAPLPEGAVFRFPEVLTERNPVVRVALEPSAVGPLNCRISSAGSVVRIHQFILP
jgi:hypothetical protein